MPPRRPAGMPGGNLSPLNGAPQAERNGNLPSAIGGAGSFNVDSSDLVTLSQNLKMVKSDIDSLASSVAELTTRLTAAAGAASGVASGTKRIKGPDSLRTKGSTSLSASGFSSGPGAQSGGGGNGNGTTTPGTFGGAGKSLAFGTASEVTAGFAGQINSYVAGFKGSGTALDYQSGLSVALFGGNRSNVATSTAQNNLSLSQADLSKGVAGLQANPYLFTTPNSSKGKAISGFLNTAQNLNPLLGNAGASQFANLLTSAPVLNLANRFGGSNNQGALLRPINAAGGNGLGINSPQQTFSMLLKMVTGGKNFTPAQMKAMSGNSAQAAATWATIQNNVTNPGSSSYIPGITPGDLTTIRQFAAAGGNINAAQKAIGGTQAASNLGRSSTQVRNQTTQFEASEGAQKIENDFLGAINNWTKALISSQKWIAQLGVGGAAAVKTVLDIGSAGTGIISLVTSLKNAKLLKTLTSGGGAASNAASNAAAGAGGAASSTAGSGITGLASGVLIGGAATAGYAESLNYLATATANKNKYAQVLDAYYNAKGMQSQAGGGLYMPAAIFTGKVDNASSFKKVAEQLKMPESEIDAYIKKIGATGDPTGSTSTSGLQPNLAHGITAMRAANPKLQITSGHRTSRQQANLYALKGGHQVASPGHSLHERGKAADIGPRSQLGWVARNAKKFGLATPDRSEPWHVQAMGDPVNSGTGVTGSAVVSAAEAYIGEPYSWGGGNAKGPTLGTASGARYPYQATHTVGLDCSGLVVAAYGKLGITLPRTAAAQSRVGTAVRGLGSAQPGDLIFYAGSDGSAGEPGHVAIYIGGGKQVAAPETGQRVQIQSVPVGDIVSIRRIVHGGAGQAVAQVATAAVGGSANATTSSATAASTGLSGGLSGVNVGLANTFVSQVANTGGWLGSVGMGSAPLTTPGLPGVGTLGSTGGSPSSNGGGTTPSAVSGGTGSYMPNQAITNSVKAVTSNKQVQLAMLTGAVLESGNNPTSKGAGSYGAWQIQMGSSNPGVTISQAENPAWAARYMVGQYAGAVGRVPSNLWGSSPADAAAQVAALAERPAHPSGSQAMAYIDNEGPNVGPAYNTAVKEMGDPSGYRAAGGLPANAPMVTMPGGGGGGRQITINLPVTVVGVSQADAQMLATMVIQALRGSDELTDVSR